MHGGKRSGFPVKYILFIVLVVIAIYGLYQYHTLQTEFSKVEKRAEQFRSQNEEAAQKIEDLMEEKNKHDAFHKRQTKELDELKEKMHKEEDACLREKEDLGQRLETSKTNYKSLKSNNEALKVQFSEVEIKGKKCEEDQIVIAKQHKDEFDKMVQEKDKDIGQLRDELAKIKQDKADLGVQVNDAQKQHSDALTQQGNVAGHNIVNPLNNISRQEVQETLKNAGQHLKDSIQKNIDPLKAIDGFKNVGHGLADKVKKFLPLRSGNIGGGDAAEHKDDTQHNAKRDIQQDAQQPDAQQAAENQKLEKNVKDETHDGNMPKDSNLEGFKAPKDLKDKEVGIERHDGGEERNKREENHVLPLANKNNAFQDNIPDKKDNPPVDQPVDQPVLSDDKEKSLAKEKHQLDAPDKANRNHLEEEDGPGVRNVPIAPKPDEVVKNQDNNDNKEVDVGNIYKEEKDDEMDVNNNQENDET